jgi:peptidoglycan/xylan/chitin deacetylase (PgdA/CDA1 family)
MYLIKAPWLLKTIYPSFVWHINTKEKALYLTFDDGPHKTATPFVLNELKKYNAKATFFCIGKNVAAYPEIYQQILKEEHAVGNHTYHHLNGWKTKDEIYINDISKATEIISSNLFRPPYGRIKRTQSSIVNRQSSIIMWDVLSGDFDIKLNPEKCLANVLYHSKPGSIIVFHDSTKAWNRMSFALPRVLEQFSKEGYTFKAIGR